ncbi:OmpP1/FadL family transporter [Roseimaritima sediminicola]|uniref:OmpP1/FadL family transporter n=1 Tax=Roseimaritima sediminicola TaxID=2662066 RepID=UPI001386C1B4|nr:outer membrane protein transport protein [Roseimaritima sediminicola]
MRFSQCFLGMVLTVLVLQPVHAAGTISNALGARQAGRGGTNIAMSDNGVVLLDNAAGMERLVGRCDQHSSYVDFGFAALFTDLSYRDAENPTTAAADNPSGLGHFMLARRVHEDVVFGFGAFTPAGFGADYDLRGPATVPGQHTYKSFGALMRILPGLSARLTDRLTVGGTLGVAVSHVELEGPYHVNSAPLRGMPTVLDLQTTGAALSWSCGLQYELSPRTTLGARYQSANRFRSDGRASLAIAPLGVSYYDVDVAMTWASSVGLGLAHQLDDCQRISVDLQWEFWSSAFDEVGLSFTNPDNPVFLAAAGPRFDEAFPLHWEDSVVVGLGYERRLAAGRTVRCGYRYQDNPLPAATTTTFLQTTLEHHFAVGYGWQHADWQWDLAYQFAFAPKVHTGTSLYPGGDFSAADVRTNTHMIFCGAMRRF